MTYISEDLRRVVFRRAGGKCEYCLIHQRHRVKKHEVDHIFAEKHGGHTTSDNLCLGCFNCNRHKGSDLSSLDPQNGEIVPLFHPRRDQWADHFRLEDAWIQPLTAKGRVTVFLLHFNDREQIRNRELLIKAGFYP